MELLATTFVCGLDPGNATSRALAGRHLTISQMTNESESLSFHLQTCLPGSGLTKTGASQVSHPHPVLMSPRHQPTGCQTGPESDDPPQFSTDMDTKVAAQSSRARAKKSHSIPWNRRACI